MEPKAKRHIVVKTDSPLSKMYPYDLNFYDRVPQGEMSFNKFEAICNERISVLALVEQVYLKNPDAPSLNSKHALIDTLMEHDFVDYAELIKFRTSEPTEERLKIREKDQISYLTLMIALSINSDTQQYWWKKQESLLFLWRCAGLSTEEITKFICVNKLNYKPISKKEKEIFKDELKDCCPYVKDIDSTNFYKVHFNKVLKLVGKFQIFLKNGTAYIPECKMSYLFLYHFKKNMMNQFEAARCSLLDQRHDKRLWQTFSYISKFIKSKCYSKYKNMTVDDVDKLAEFSFPLCMKTMHEHLRNHHHLTNGARLQYTLFLKGIGLSLERALELWKNEFTKVIDEQTFNKRYKYHVYHMYGQKGGNHNYFAFNCEKIIDSLLTERDCHGCPFKYLLPKDLDRKLSGYGIYQSDRKEIVAIAKNGQYTTACKKLFEVTHSTELTEFIEHPNVYFQKSVKHTEHMEEDELFW